MAKKLRIHILRGEIYVYKWLVRYYRALLLTWHRSVAIGVFAIAVTLSSVGILCIALWVFSGAVARAFAGDILQGALWLLASMILLALSKFGINAAKNLLPIHLVDMDEGADEVDF